MGRSEILNDLAIAFRWTANYKKWIIFY